MSKKKIAVKPPSAFKTVVSSKTNTDNSPNGRIDLGSLDLTKITKNTEMILSSNESILDLFPEIELSMQILASSILSPKDLTTTSTIYSIEESPMPTTITGGLIDTIKKHIKSRYKLEDKLFDIVIESLFEKGSYLEAIIPEASVDRVINGNGESLTTSLESYIDSFEDSTLTMFNSNYTKSDIKISSLSDKIDLDNLITVTEDCKILDAKSMYRRELSRESKLNVSTESDEYNQQLKKGMDKELERIFKPTPRHKDSEVVTVHTATENTRRSIGSPLMMALPIESVVPIHVPGEPENHVGYFILLDEHGTPIKRSETWSTTDDEKLEKLMEGTISSKASMELNALTKSTPTLKNMNSLAGAIIDNKIKNMLTNSKIGDIAEVSDVSHIYSIMMSRVLAKQKTRMLYLPAEVVVNYTFKYKANGLGESMLEKIAILASMRAVLLFSRLMADVKNSITNTKISATLDNDDADPEATMEAIAGHAMKARQNVLPLGIRNISDLSNWSTKAGMSFEFKHDSIPDMTIETEETTTDYKEPEGILDEKLSKRIIQSFGLTPEMVDEGFSPEFATTIVANNALLHKRVVQLQNKMIPMLSRHIRVILNNDMIINDALKKYIMDNIKDIKKTLPDDSKAKLKELNATDDFISDWLLEVFIRDLTVSLPSPDSYEQDGLKDSFDQYKESVTDYIESFISTDALPVGMKEEFADSADEFKDAAIHTILRKWMVENNYLPEIHKILDTDRDGEPISDVLEEYSLYKEQLAKALTALNKMKTEDDTTSEDDSIDEDSEDNSEDNDSNDNEDDLDF